MKRERSAAGRDLPGRLPPAAHEVTAGGFLAEVAGGAVVVLLPVLVLLLGAFGGYGG